MVTIQNSEELDQLIDTLSSARYSSEAWIGLYSVIKWRWSDGSSAEYRNWDILGDEPNFIAASQFCVSYSFEAWWDDYCENKYTVVCSNGTQLDPEYVYVTEEMDWSSARRYCRENFIELAAVRNDVENKMFQRLVPSGIYPWIGLFRDPNFYWSDGSSFLFSNWEDVSNPLGSMTDICGVTSVMGRWRFLSCETKLPFVCYNVPTEIMQLRVTLRLKTENSVNLNEAVLKANILKKARLEFVGLYIWLHIHNLNYFFTNKLYLKVCFQMFTVCVSQLQDRLQENRVSGVTLKWREPPDGEVFKKERQTMNTFL
ncbi:lymphocyte antigen 75-like [Girardinichthys multiradiatus]|uniref:lymphocyte antigen 75-like n=1 Tax=Girardinichthys multiradiatus TaxID=208333 RepID=UPI001FAB7A07|nr:lymphocyte antigen 75-like [Girardinichthys multiradiatus]